MGTAVLGISAFYHDSAAAIVKDGLIVAAAQEERFSRVKHDASFPRQAVKYVLDESGMLPSEVNGVSFYDKPLLKFERLLETYNAFAPRGLASFVKSTPVWIKEKLAMRRLLKNALKEFDLGNKEFYFPEHHLSHSASAYYPSGFSEAAILTIDGVGEWATATIGQGKNNNIKICRELRFPHSLGLLYSSFTYFLGFKVNSGEYKVMGLSPYGDPLSSETIVFKEKILKHLVDVRDDGSFLLNMDYFDFATGLKMIDKVKWEFLFQLRYREPESEILRSHSNFARAAQEVTEMIILKLARTTKELTGSDNLVMAGGVALNCAANSRVYEEGIFKNIWIQPAAGDAGGAIGAAYAAYFLKFSSQAQRISSSDLMHGSFLGPEYSDTDIQRVIDLHEAIAEKMEDFDQLVSVVSKNLAEGQIVGWFQGRMEFGPRALGNRSILADPGIRGMQQIINQKTKFREGFRPFAPSVLEEDADKFFEPGDSSPYMLFLKKIKTELRKKAPDNAANLSLRERLAYPLSTLPAVTHVDYSARAHTVNQSTNPKFWQLLTEFKRIKGYGVLVNTSFNVRGEPIVCTPEDAFLGFMRMEMDCLVLGNFILEKKRQRIVATKTVHLLSD